MTTLLDLNQKAKTAIVQIYLYSDIVHEPFQNDLTALSVHSASGFKLFDDFEIATVPAILFYGLKNTNDATVLGVHYINKTTGKPDMTKVNDLVQACRAQTSTIYQQIQLNNERMQVIRDQENRLQESITRDSQKQKEKDDFKSWFDSRVKERDTYKKIEGSDIHLKFRVFNGSTYEQKFLKSHLIKDLYQFINHFDIFNEKDMSVEDKEEFYCIHKDHGLGFVISSMYPKQELLDMTLTLEQANVNGMLIVEEV